MRPIRCARMARRCFRSSGCSRWRGSSADSRKLAKQPRGFCDQAVDAVGEKASQTVRDGIGACSCRIDYFCAAKTAALLQGQTPATPRLSEEPQRSGRTCGDLREMVMRAYGARAKTKNLRAIL